MSFVPCPTFTCKQHFVAPNGRYLCTDDWMTDDKIQSLTKFMEDIENLFELFNVSQSKQNCRYDDEFTVHVNGGTIHMYVTEYAKIYGAQDVGKCSLQAITIEDVVAYIAATYPESFKKQPNVAQHFVDSDVVADGSLD